MPCLARAHALEPRPAKQEPVNRVVSPAPRSRAWLPAPALAALAAALVALVAIAVLSYRALVARSEAAHALDHTDEIQDHLHHFLSSMKDAETGQRGFLLTGVERYLDPYQLALGDIATELTTLRRLTIDDPAQQRRLDVIAPLVDARLAEARQTIDLQRAGDTAGALAVVQSDRGHVVMERLRGSIDAMLEAEQARLVQRTAAWEDSGRWSSYTMFGGVALIAGMIGLIGVLASRDFRAVEAESWSRRVELALSSELQGDHRLASIGDKALHRLVDALGARVGGIYVTEGDQLRRIAGHAIAPGLDAVRLGDGLTGQVARDARVLHLHKVPAGYLDVRSALGKTAPLELAIAPAIVDGAVQAVVELGFLHRLDRIELETLDRTSEPIAVAIRTARDRHRLEELLEEVQRQAEELTTQQEELRVSNEELEHQAQVLQSSQVQLQHQQAELEQANVLLEEQARSLAEQRDELVRTGNELQRSNDYKSQFVANMSHELRTPLNSVLLLARLLADNRDGKLDAEQVRFAQTIHGAGNDLLALINDILDLSKIEAGRLDVRLDAIPLARLADDLSRTFHPIASARQLALEFRIEPGAPDVIDSDPTRLPQILRNLLSNALKFTERGGVSLAISGAGDTVQLAVHDTGIGIPADQHERIFEAFRQTDAGSNRRFNGTGLGLTISRDLAHLLGGELRVASAPGQGSTFTLTLPVQPDREVALAARRSTARRSPAPTVPRAAPSAPPPPSVGPAPFPDDRDRAAGAARSLLVIEDDVAFARVIFDLAHELEFACVVATTADDGLALARRIVPSAVVLDIGLPDRSGLTVLDALKRDPEIRHIPVHVCSVTDYTRGALAMGAAGYALKPVDRERMVEAIKQLEARFTQKLRRVLIVGDDASARDATARLLAGDDVELTTAATAGEALDRLAATTFDCMVLDLELPDRNGLELLGDMARSEHHAFPPVIVYSDRALAQDEVRALERLSHSIVIKGARSPERLLDEVTLFLHQVEARLPPDRRRMLRDARSRDAALDGRRILVVEDDVRNVFALTNVLEPSGAAIEIARNGREALDRLAARPDVDLVLMDIMMPEMDGLEATRRMRQDPRLARLPVIALTAKAMADDRERCLAAGANDYIAKPLDVDRLLSLVRVWIGS
jgi:signal transduction histidine kinase/DNA-binding response OmpR family regulator/CHASE3 domain sensor protein